MPDSVLLTQLFHKVSVWHYSIWAVWPHLCECCEAWEWIYYHTSKNTGRLPVFSVCCICGLYRQYNQPICAKRPWKCGLGLYSSAQVLHAALIWAKSANHLRYWLGFYFEGNIGLFQINLAVWVQLPPAMLAGIPVVNQVRAPPPPSSSILSWNLPCIITAGGNKCCDIRLFNPLSSKKCILSRSNLLSLPVCLFSLATLRFEVFPDVWMFV